MVKNFSFFVLLFLPVLFIAAIYFYPGLFSLEYFQGSDSAFAMDSCPFRAITGIPCPLCGLTRSVSESLRGNFEDSLYFHPLGIPALIVFVVIWGRAVFLKATDRINTLRLKKLSMISVLALLLTWFARLSIIDTYQF